MASTFYSPLNYNNYLQAVFFTSVKPVPSLLDILTRLTPSSLAKASKASMFSGCISATAFKSVLVNTIKWGLFLNKGLMLLKS